MNQLKVYQAILFKEIYKEKLTLFLLMETSNIFNLDILVNMKMIPYKAMERCNSMMEVILKEIGSKIKKLDKGV